jgi:hypothetical protein
MRVITLYKGTPSQIRIGPLLAATMRDNKDEIKAAQLQQLEPMEMLELVTKLAHAGAKRVDPNFTEEQAANIVDLENFGEIFAACFGASIPEVKPGETRGTANPST